MNLIHVGADRQHDRINGGYTPHLHFGVREGRIAEKGAPLFGLVSTEPDRVPQAARRSHVSRTMPDKHDQALTKQGIRCSDFA